MMAAMNATPHGRDLAPIRRKPQSGSACGPAHAHMREDPLREHKTLIATSGGPAGRAIKLRTVAYVTQESGSLRRVDGRRVGKAAMKAAKRQRRAAVR